MIEDFNFGICIKQVLQPLADKGCFCLPRIQEYNQINAHIFYIVLPSCELRTQLISFLKEQQIHAVFHYLSLHKSDYFKTQYAGEQLTQSDHYTCCLLRLPLFNDMTENQVKLVCQSISDFFDNKRFIHLIRHGQNITFFYQTRKLLIELLKCLRKHCPGKTCF